ncbi:MAG: T9SS type A sorting domain-containing protein [Sphingobacteriales bacterium]|nr:MAG: T9SS type A sorting domain-containing protein [Sphingobacteriales bacterium]
MKALQIVLVTLLMTSLNYICSAQSIGPATLNAAGGSTAVSGNTHEWSVGEMVLVNTVTTAGLVVTQGVLQPMLQVTGIHDNEFALEGMSIYPNPASDQLNIKFNLPRNLQVSLKLSDISGRTQYFKKIKDHNGSALITLDFKAYAAGVYLLQVTTADKTKIYTNTFKVVKN